jgi:hypothetical protein
MTSAAAPASAPPGLSPDEALRVARIDAERVYRDLDRYRIQVARETDGWHIDYELKDPNVHGGGPHYVIDPATGKITAKRYEQ